MSEIQKIIPVGKSELVGIAAELFAEGYRFVQVCCATLESAYELTYSFDKGYRLRNLRFVVTPDEEVPSISVIYPNAFLYENEIHDLFGLNIKNIAVDYHGTLYRTTVKIPFSIGNVKARVSLKPDAGATEENTPTAKAPTEVPGAQDG